MLGIDALSVLPLSTLPTTGTVVFPELSWAPGYPSPAPQKEAYNSLKVAAFVAVFALGQLAVPSLSWEPKYPSAAPTPFVIQAKQQSTAFVPVVIVAPAIDTMAWRPRYPDRGARGDQRPPTGLSVWTVPLANLAVPVLSWGSVWPAPKRIDVRVWASQPAFVPLVVTAPVTVSKLIFVSASFGTLVINGSIVPVN